MCDEGGGVQNKKSCTNILKMEKSRSWWGGGGGGRGGQADPTDPVSYGPEYACLLFVFLLRFDKDSADVGPQHEGHCKGVDEIKEGKV